jgi:NAD(P)H-dependent FMN reductase
MVMEGIRVHGQLLLISGSVRAASTNTAILRLAANLCAPWFRGTLYGELDALPAFNPDVEVLGEDDPTFPAAARRLRTQIAQADALLLSTPEYAHGLPGAFKNALDWLVGSTAFPGIPVGLVNVSARSIHAPAQLLEIVRTMSASVVADACITLAPPGSGDPRSDSDLTAESQSRIREALRALHAAVAASPRRSSSIDAGTS